MLFLKEKKFISIFFFSFKGLKKGNPNKIKAPSRYLKFDLGPPQIVKNKEKIN